MDIKKIQILDKKKYSNKEENYRFNFLNIDSNNREVDIHILNDCVLTGENLIYPNPLIYSCLDGVLYNPNDEIIMSLKDLDKKNNFHFSLKYDKIIDEEVFYFIYNTDNYYHFLYDTLPYLISYKFLKQNNNNLKLLMGYPNLIMKKNYKFVEEILQILDITEKDIIFVEDNTLYKKIFISSSYTHGIDSNLPPRNEIYELYDFMVDKIKNIHKFNHVGKKYYISRRSWIHSDYSNIGTNYTSRRKMINEDKLVEELQKNGFEEIFTENMSTLEKIILFSSSECIVGAIGGGMGNLLFSNKKVKSIVITSPEFLKINNRFKYSFINSNNIIFEDTFHVSKEEHKKFCRVKTNNGIVGEIIEINGDLLTINYSTNSVAGWNSEIEWNKAIINKRDVKLLDHGLNSEWECNIHSLLRIL